MLKLIDSDDYSDVFGDNNDLEASLVRELKRGSMPSGRRSRKIILWLS